MIASIGIRREEKHFEARTPLTPDQVKYIFDEYNIHTFIQPSTLRAYSDEEYEKNGAKIEENIWGKTNFIFALKEIPEELIYPEKIYTFFSHTIKGQTHNMPLLKKIIDSKSTLIDYEKIIDGKNRRLIFFGNYAGFAGMIDSLWALGQRLRSEGIKTPFEEIKKAYEYNSLIEAKKELKKIGESIRKNGINAKLKPLLFGFLGYGNVSKGAQEILDCFPVKEILPNELLDSFDNMDKEGNFLYKVVFYENHLVTPTLSNKSFNLQDYYDNPEKYKSQFEKYLPFFTVFINAIYWDSMYPRFITKKALSDLNKKNDLKLKVIGDISCDIEGAVELTVKSTYSDNSVFVYDLIDNKAVMGFEGRGPVILAVDNLPCELPKESSTFFGSKLIKLIPQIINSDYNKSFDNNDLSEEIKKAVIVYKGELTSNYLYLNKFLNKLN